MKKHIKLGMGIYTNAFAMGAMPNPTGSADIDAIKSNVTGGLATASGAFPAIGTIKGTELVIKSSKKLLKHTKKIY